MTNNNNEDSPKIEKILQESTEEVQLRGTKRLEEREKRARKEKEFFDYAKRCLFTPGS